MTHCARKSPPHVMTASPVLHLTHSLGTDESPSLSGRGSSRGRAKRASARDAGGLPKLLNDDPEYNMFFLDHEHASASAVQAVEDALAKRSQ